MPRSYTGLCEGENDVSLYICSTYYHVYIVLLKCLGGAEKGRPDLVVCDDIPTGKRLAEKLKESGLFFHVWFVEQSKLPREWGRNLIDWCFFQKRRRYQAISPLLPFRLDTYSDVYIFHDGTPLGMYLNDAGKPYHLIEDSLNFYQVFDRTPQAAFLKRDTLKYRLRKCFRLGYFSLGDSFNTIDVEVNEARNLQLTQLPVIEISRKALLENLDDRARSVILDIFEVGQPLQVGENTALLLTEPLCLDRVCSSLEEQVERYQKIVNDLKENGYQVLIKPHPRDTADYTVLGERCLKADFPVELLPWIGGEFACVAAVSSSAVYSVKAKQYTHYPLLSDRVTRKGELWEM